MESKEIEAINKIIKEQDIVSVYMINNSDVLFEDYIIEPRISFFDLPEFIMQHDSILEGFSTKNLFNLLGSVHISKKEDIEKIKGLIEGRLEKKNFFCEDIDYEFQMQGFHSTNRVFNKLDKETREQIIAGLKQRLGKIQEPRVAALAQKLNKIGDVANFLYYYENGVFTEEKIAFLEEMLRQDEHALEYVNFGIFSDEIFGLGAEFVQYVSKFPRISTQLVALKNHNPQLFSILANRIKQYEVLQDNYYEIESMIEYFAKRCYNLELTEITDEVIQDIINCAISSKKFDYKLIKIDYTEDYKQKLDQEYERQYKETNAYYSKLKKRDIYINKRFSISEKEAKEILESYTGDLEKLKEVTEEDRVFIKALKQALRLEEGEIDGIFADCKKEYTPIDILNFRNRMERMYVLTYPKTMKQTEEQVTQKQEAGDSEFVQQIEVDGKKVVQIKINGHFSMLLHSTDPGFVGKQNAVNEETDFIRSWKESRDKSNHIISMVYANQDFLGCPPVGENGVMYGFTTLNFQNIRLMGNTDINTYLREFSYRASMQQYMTAGGLPYASRRVYSEVAVERQGTNPDYVVIFDDMDAQVKRNAYKAASQFGIPVLYIDKREIEQQQIASLQDVLTTFQEQPSPEMLKQLLNKYETNVAGWLLNRSDKEKDTSYTQDINNSRFKDDFTQIWSQIEGAIKDYLEQIKTAQGQDTDLSHLARMMEVILEERDLYQDSEKNKPITKTRISFNDISMIEELNKTLEAVGGSEYKVDIGKIPTAEEYKLKMTQVLRNAILGPNKVDLQDVEAADKVMARTQQASLKKEEI